MRQLFFVLFISALGAQLTAQSIGIGTTSPHTSALLDLKSSTLGLLLPRTSTTTRNTMVGVKGLTVYDTTLNKIFYHQGTIWMEVTTGSHPTQYWSPLGTHVYNNNTGNVGIGISIPPRKLTVLNDILIQGGVPRLEISGDGGAGISRINFELTSNTTDYTILQTLDKLFLSRQTGLLGFVSDLVVSETGNVGVGTSEPATRLHIVNGTDVGPASGGYIQFGEDNGNIGIDNNEIQARANGAPSRLVLQNDGSVVQIGNAIVPAGYKVGITGAVICEELKIQDAADWPDYVFHESYTLRSLDALRNFISANKHLPNIPSAAEVEASGIEVGDMQKRMMEKIEELTLYILELEERQQTLETNLAQITSRKRK